MHPAGRSDATGYALSAFSVVSTAFGSEQFCSALSATSVVYTAIGTAPFGSATVFTAFGERISGANPTESTRYGYAGEWGYQSHADFPFLHVGHRYYDPSTGRFLQRDPIGIGGGLNVYGYVGAEPTISIDPSGLTDIIPVGAPKGPGYPVPEGGRIKIPVRVPTPIPSSPYPPPPVPWYLPNFSFGAPQALACVAAFAAGYATGTAIDYGVKAATGERLSEHIGRALARICQSCFLW